MNQHRTPKQQSHHNLNIPPLFIPFIPTIPSHFLPPNPGIIQPQTSSSSSTSTDSILSNDDIQIKQEEEQQQPQNDDGLNYDDLILALWNMTNTNLSNNTLPPPVDNIEGNSSFHTEQTNEELMLEYCPNYKVYDARSRKESKERISKHLRERQKQIIKCIHSAIEEIDALTLPFNQNKPKPARFEDDGQILKGALNQLRIQIDEWDGVQIGQCKKERSDGTKLRIDSWQKFAKKGALTSLLLLCFFVCL